MAEDIDGAQRWRKSSTSGDTTCVEVYFGNNSIHVRNSRNPGGPQLVFSATEWAAFLAGVRAGEFDLPGGGF